MRTGSEYLSSLNDGRQILLDGELVGDVTKSSAFSSIAKQIAKLYDISADPANNMQFYSEEISGPANIAYSIPRSQRDLRARREAMGKWAKATHGWVGRTPDNVGSYLAGFAANSHFFDNGEKKFSENIKKYYNYVIKNDLFVTYAIVPPQYSRATSPSGWDGGYIQAGVVRETEEGLIVRGSQQLATGAAVADEVLVTCIKPLGSDEVDFAVSFALPVATPGLKLVPRRPYAPGATSEFDYPLTSRYDEPDTLIILDDVLVPWGRVFVDRDIVRCRDQFFATGAHRLGNWQAQIRFVEKLKFIAAIARKMTQINGTDRIPGVIEKLGEIAALVSSARSAVLAAEYTAEPDANGVFLPGAEALYGAMGLQPEIYPRIIQILRDLAGGGVLQLPSSKADMVSDTTKADIEHYIGSPVASSEERIKLFRLAWDVIGSEFGGRHQQYELFYAGAPFVVKGVYSFRNFNYENVVNDLDIFLDSYHV